MFKVSYIAFLFQSKTSLMLDCGIFLGCKMNAVCHQEESSVELYACFIFELNYALLMNN